MKGDERRGAREEKGRCMRVRMRMESMKMYIDT